MLELSPLGKTWLLDVDGTIVKHNGYKLDGHDTLLEGVIEFFDKIGPEDTVILLTAREGRYAAELKEFLADQQIRFDYLLTDLPAGERILVNDSKPSGLNCAYAVSKLRDQAFNVDFIIRDDR